MTKGLRPRVNETINLVAAKSNYYNNLDLNYK